MGSKNAMFIPRGMHRNQAFRKLNSSSIFVLFEFLSRRQLKQVPTRDSRKKDWIIINNGKIFFTYDEAKSNYGISRSTFCRAIDQLVDLGFIDITHQGGGMMQDASNYGISERWKEYGKKDFLIKSRPKDKRGLGFTKENWEKTAGKHKKIKQVSTTRDTTSSTAHDTVSHKYLVTPSISNSTNQIDINYYIFKGLKVLDAFHPTQYH
jgi:hypothetical protein